MKISINIILFSILSMFLFSGCIDNKCDTCFGTGKTNCITCFGSAVINCSTCSGSGKTDCLYCSGRGNQICSSCSGSGNENRYDYGYDYSDGGQYHNYFGSFPCRKCNQTGRVKCSNYSCENGKVKCSNYSCKDGKVKCSNYSCEDGKEKCIICKGTGEEESGFFSGIKDGFLVVFSLIGKIFSSDIHIYALNTSGLSYWIGFILGVLIFGSASRSKS